MEVLDATDLQVFASFGSQLVRGRSRALPGGRPTERRVYADIRTDDYPIPELRAIVKIYRGAYPEYSSRTWPALEGTGGHPILYP